MSGLCGWFHHPESLAANRADIEAMGAVLGRYDKAPMHALSTKGGGVAVSCWSREAVFRDSQSLAAVWGKVRFKDARLQGLARLRGPAEALSKGHGEKGA